MKAAPATHEMNPQHPPNCLLRSERELQRRLAEMGIDITCWGSNAHKSLHDLWQEVVYGEAHIHEEAPHRSLHVTQVIIRRGNRVLIEAEQAFKRGGHRRRQRPPAEKMRPGETVISAALRCLREELGIDVSRVMLRPETYRRSIADGASHSYPGLRTRWHFHRIEAQVDGLPAYDFVTEEVADNIHDPIGRHFWEWQPLR